MRGLLRLSIAVAALGACDFRADFLGTAYRCSDGRCPSGFVCLEARCVPYVPDGPVADAGDAAPADAADGADGPPADAPVPDAPAPDAPLPADAPALDAFTRDAPDPGLSSSPSD